MLEKDSAAPEANRSGAVSGTAGGLNQHRQGRRNAARPQRRLSPVGSARIELVSRQLQGHGPLDLQASRATRYDWAERGLTLDKRDRAVDTVVGLSKTAVEATASGIAVRLVAAGERP